jgi:CheY-like chemotaxis protein
VESAASDGYDLAIMDLQMPEMDGLEAVKRLRDKEKRTGMHLPIIAVTAHAMKGDRELCLAVGMDDYVSKPVRPQQLIAVVEALAVFSRPAVPSDGGHQDAEAVAPSGQTEVEVSCV